MRHADTWPLTKSRPDVHSARQYVRLILHTAEPVFLLAAIQIGLRSQSRLSVDSATRARAHQGACGMRPKKPVQYPGIHAPSLSVREMTEISSASYARQIVYDLHMHIDCEVQIVQEYIGSWQMPPG